MKIGFARSLWLTTGIGRISAFFPLFCALTLVACSSGPISEPLLDSSPTISQPTNLPPTRAPHTAIPTAQSVALPTATQAPTATSTPIPFLSPLPTSLPEPTSRPYVIALDAGHGGRDLGAIHRDVTGHMDYTESEVNLDLVLRLRDLLEAEGLVAYLTRDADEALNEPRLDVNGNGIIDHVDESQARVDAVNARGADLLLSIHQNAFYTADGEAAHDVGGTVTFYCADRPFADKSLRFAELIQEHLIAALNDLGHDARDRGVEDDLVLYVEGELGSHLILLGPVAERIVRPSTMPGALSETLFLTHAREGELARDPAALDRLARAYADAVLAYLGEMDLMIDE